MKVTEEEVESYRWVACKLERFSLQGKRCVEIILAVWGYNIGALASEIQPCMLHMPYTSVGVGGFP